MDCFKTEETLFEGVLPFHAKTSPTAQLLPKQYFSTSVGVLQYCRESTTVLPGKYYSTAKEVLANDKILI